MFMSSRHSFVIFSAGLALVLFAGCTTTGPAISSHADTAVKYSSYKTFMMLKPSGLAPDRNAAITPMLVRELREAATQAFTSKGLTKSPDAYADALILVHGGLHDKLEVQELGLGYGRLGRGLGQHQDLNSTTEGSLFVDVFDAKTRELVWRGSAVAEVSGMPKPDDIKSVLNSIIARYPN
jgi:hypothetical protein